MHLSLAQLLAVAAADEDTELHRAGSCCRTLMAAHARLPKGDCRLRVLGSYNVVGSYRAACGSRLPPKAAIQLVQLARCLDHSSLQLSDARLDARVSHWLPSLVERLRLWSRLAS